MCYFWRALFLLITFCLPYNCVLILQHICQGSSYSHVDWHLDRQGNILYKTTRPRWNCHCNCCCFKQFEIIHNFSNCSQFLKFFTVVYNAALQKLHLSMLSSVRLCCLSEIALILVLFSEFSWNRLQKSWKIWNSAAPRFQIFHSFFRRFHSNSEKSTLISCNFT